MDGLFSGTLAVSFREGICAAKFLTTKNLDLTLESFGVGVKGFCSIVLRHLKV